MTGRTIVITSGKGGVGKTTATANLGTALAMRGQKVVVIDADIGLRNLDVIMGLENRIVYDLVNVIEGKCKMHQAMIRDKHQLELFLIPAAQTRDKDSIEPEQLRELCEKLEQEFDYVLIDCPAGIEGGFKNAIGAAKEAILVTTPEVSAIRDADRVIGLLEASELHRPKLIINRINTNLVKHGDMMDKDDIVELLSVEILGLGPADEHTITAGLYSGVDGKWPAFDWRRTPAVKRIAVLQVEHTAGAIEFQWTEVEPIGGHQATFVYG